MNKGKNIAIFDTVDKSSAASITSVIARLKDHDHECNHKRTNT